ncbi:MAG: hypothetical protein OWQ57_11055 [Sulfobacillus sp.]|nr:hypothetical protein [Sulfobacillus sp.]
MDNRIGVVIQRPPDDRLAELLRITLGLYTADVLAGVVVWGNGCAVFKDDQNPAARQICRYLDELVECDVPVYQTEGSGPLVSISPQKAAEWLKDIRWVIVH